MASANISARMGGIETSQAVEDYCKTIFVLSERSTGQPVATGAIAQRLGVADPSVSTMLKRLGELGLISHEPYRGVLLTDSGRRVALEILRHHRLLEAFLYETFDMPWDRVHDEAEVLEHAISEELEEMIAEKLGHPEFDPHGDPIPARDGTVAGTQTVALADLQPGQGGRFVRVSDSDPEMLRFLTTAGIGPGQDVLVVERQPFDGPLWVDFSGPKSKNLPRREVIGLRLARAMRVVNSDD